MATTNFTQFNTNTTLSSNDFLVGYYGDGSKEFKLNISTLQTFLEPTKTISTDTEFFVNSTTILVPAESLNLTIPANTKYAVTGQLLLKEVGEFAPGIDYQVQITTTVSPTGIISVYGNHNRYDLVDLLVGVIIPTDISVTTKTKILQLDATGYNFFSLPVSFVVDNSSNVECTVKHYFAQSTLAVNGTLVLGIGSYLIGHPIS